MKFTIVTVVFDIEYPLLLLQARSIVLYVKKDDIEEIIFIQNCDINNQKNTIFFESSINILRANGFMVRIVHRDKFFVGIQASGWELQQSLKLMASAIVHTSYYLVLDTKNHFIREVNCNRLFVGDKAISHKTIKYGSMLEWLKKPMASLNLDISENEKSMPTTTPYLINTKLVIELTKYIGESIDKFLLKNKKATEFFLYFAYLKKTNLIDKLYLFTDAFCATFFTKYPSTEEEVNHVKKLLENKNVFCVGVHRNRFLSCSEDFKKYLFELWKKYELIYGESDFNSIFDAMTIYKVAEHTKQTLTKELPREDKIQNSRKVVLFMINITKTLCESENLTDIASLGKAMQS
ncbi:MAG: DUF6492 family protein, partial [Campylobacteraceae bacterium]|nr:DUF6492 family protein [Campylobacteraceae bacterium]